MALADLGVGWYVFGAHAVVFWGRPRFTEDVDITVAPNLRVPVISAEDLIVTKVLAGRPKDLDDAHSVLQVRQSLDLAAIRHVLRSVESAPGVSDLLPAFESLLRRT